MHRPPPHVQREFAPFLYSNAPGYNNFTSEGLTTLLQNTAVCDMQWFSDTDTLQIVFPSLANKYAFMISLGLEADNTALAQPTPTMLRIPRLDAYIQSATESAEEPVLGYVRNLFDAIARARALKPAAEQTGLPQQPPPAPERVFTPAILWSPSELFQRLTAPAFDEQLRQLKVQRIVANRDESGRDLLIIQMPDAQTYEAFQTAFFGRVISPPNEKNLFSFAVPFDMLSKIAERSELAQVVMDHYERMTGHRIEATVPVPPSENPSESSEPSSTSGSVADAEPVIEVFDEGRRSPFRGESYVDEQHFKAILASVKALKDDPKNEIELEEKGPHQYAVSCTKLNSKECDVQATFTSNPRSVSIAWKKGRFEDFYQLTAMTLVHQAKNDPSIRQLKMNITPPEQAKKLLEALSEAAAQSELNIGLKLNGEDYRWDASGKSFSKAPKPDAPRSSAPEGAEEHEAVPPGTTDDSMLDLEEPRPGGAREDSVSSRRRPK
ncbi:MAG: hypothetical protein CMF48_07515 [Legionellales bacterium]|nr:hypothetical protein [Legionellales bacterium]|tara:strand:+ start:677 stop:2161 length:1485 start_codon:yes stop_codon:yes gene_type:complete